jgi:voltage-gated sodium channel
LANALRQETTETLASDDEDNDTNNNVGTRASMKKVSNSISRIVDKAWFEAVVAVLILVNCVTMGLEVELKLGRAQFYDPVHKGIDSLFAIVFLAELLLRLAAVGWRNYVPGCGVRKSIAVWNMLEAIIVLVSCATAWINFEESGLLQVITVLRALRLMRVARIVSRVRLFHEVWLLLRGLAGSMRVLFWTVVVIGIITYMFAVFGVALISVEIEREYESLLAEKELAMEQFRGYTNCTDAARGALGWTGSNGLAEMAALSEATRGITAWIFTLLQVLTLDSWMSLARPIQDIVPLSWVFFYLYIALVVFVLMNLVTAIIVDNALARSQEDERQMIQQKKREQKKAEKKCRRLFDAIDEDGNESLTIEELKSACDDPWLSRQLQVLDITSDNAEEIFRMMDTGDGLLSLEEFFEGTKRMQGPAEGRDLVRLLATTQKLARAFKVNRDGKSTLSLPVPSSAPPSAPSLRKSGPDLSQMADVMSKVEMLCGAVQALDFRLGSLGQDVVELQKHGRQ